LGSVEDGTFGQFIEGLSFNSVKVIHAWDSNRHLTGIPAQVKELVNLHKLKVEQSQLAQSIYEKVMNVLAV
jgi:hypothetical protein